MIGKVVSIKIPQTGFSQDTKKGESFISLAQAIASAQENKNSSPASKNTENKELGQG